MGLGTRQRYFCVERRKNEVQDTSDDYRDPLETYHKTTISIKNEGFIYPHREIGWQDGLKLQMKGTGTINQGVK